MTTNEAQLKIDFQNFLDKIFIPSNILSDFYTFIAIFLEVLEQEAIPYFAHSGTALGCVRHEGFIPWDDDFDIMVEEIFEDKLMSLLPLLKNYGILINEKHSTNGHYQFYMRNPKVPLSLEKFFCFDIFIGKRETINGRVVLHYKHPDFHKWFEKRYCDIADVYPVKKYNFGPLSIWGMRDYADYFSRSGFKVDEAIIQVHMIDQDWLKERLKYFTNVGLYPIRDKATLTVKRDVNFDYRGHKHYQI